MSAETAAKSEEIVIVSSTAVKDLMLALLPLFERASGRKVAISFQFAPTVAAKIKAGTQADLVVSPAPVIDELVQAGKLACRIDVFHSAIAMAVRAGAPRPDIGSADAFKRTLLAARSVAFSTGPSGALFTAVIERLGLSEALKARAVLVDGVPVGTVVASGKAEIGVQQLAELLPLSGIDIVGPLPAGLAEPIVYSSGVPGDAKDPDGARALLAFFASPETAPVIKAYGMQPA
jgi:molybdate transport system substrate-binding protein